MDDLIGTVLGGRYRLDSKIGGGWQGWVYKGKHLALGMPVAIKILPSDYADDTVMRTRIEREARRLAQLAQPNIVRVLDFGYEKGLYYIVSEFIDGPDLESVIEAEGGALPPHQALAYAEQIASALQYVHQQGIVHRDIKPGNILIEIKSGRVVLADFGLARRTQDEDLLASGLVQGVAGTPAYMSPEQCLDLPIDQRTDIYSFGLVVYGMLTGKHPFLGEHDTSQMVRNRLLREAPPAPSSLNPKLGPQIDKVLLKCLSKDRERRFQTAAEFLEALKDAIEGGASLIASIVRAFRALRALATRLLSRIPIPTVRLTVEVAILVLLAILVTLQLLGKPKDGDGDGQTTATPTATQCSEPRGSRTPPTHTAVPTTVTATLTSSPSATKPSPSRTPTGTPTATRTATAALTPTQTPLPPGGISPLKTFRVDAGKSGFQAVQISTLSYSGGLLRLHGTVRFPKVRFEDQRWLAEWAGDDVVGECGLQPTDKSIAWYPVDNNNNHQEEASGILTQWKPPGNVNCRVWIRLKAVADKRTEKIYGLYDLGRLGVGCVSGKCPK